MRQGAFVHEGVITFRASEQAPPEPVLKVSEIPLKGAHNVENVLAAVCAARLAGVEAAAIRKAVDGVSRGRASAGVCREDQRRRLLQRLQGDQRRCLDEGDRRVSGGIHLILGGKDKNSDYRQMRALLQERVKAVYTIGAAAEKIHTHIEGAVPMVSAGTLDAAIATAGRCRTARRDRAAGAGVLQLRSVRELRASGKSLQGDGSGAAQSCRAHGNVGAGIWRNESASTNGCTSQRSCWS